MTVIFPVNLPVSIKSSRFGLNINKSQFSGEFTRNRITQSHGAGTSDRWEGVFTTPALNTAQHREMSSLLNALSFNDGTFNAFNPDHKTPFGTISGSPVVDGAGQTGTSINIKSLAINETGILQAGDYIGFSSQYFEVQQDADSDGLGKATVDVLPAIRISPADLAAIVFTNPTFEAQLVETNHPQETNQNKIGVISFAWQEKV